MSKSAITATRALHRAKFRQGVIFVVLEHDFHGHADLHLIRRTVDDVADQARPFVEINERNIIGLPS